jgi:hypothetical protein
VGNLSDQSGLSEMSRRFIEASHLAVRYTAAKMAAEDLMKDHLRQLPRNKQEMVALDLVNIIHRRCRIGRVIRKRPYHASEL